MTLGPDTRWIDALLSDEAIVDRLVAYDPKFAHFRGVMNDERVATELHVADIARILGLTTEAILRIAAGGTQDRRPEDRIGEAPSSPSIAPGSSEKILDLRPLFELGQEPLAMILDAVARLPGGTDLVIEAPFHPLPLRRLLGGRGFASSARQLAAEHWRVVFRRATG